MNSTPQSPGDLQSDSSAGEPSPETGCWTEQAQRDEGRQSRALSVFTSLHSPNWEAPGPACPKPRSPSFPPAPTVALPQGPGDWVGQAGTLARRKTLKTGGGVCSPRTDIPPAHTPSTPGSGALITGATNAPENFFLPQPGRSCCLYHASRTWAQGVLELGVKDQRPRAPTFKLNKQPSGFPRPLRQGQSPALPAPFGGSPRRVTRARGPARPQEGSSTALASAESRGETGHDMLPLPRSHEGPDPTHRHLGKSSGLEPEVRRKHGRRQHSLERKQLLGGGPETKQTLRGL